MRAVRIVIVLIALGLPLSAQQRTTTGDGAPVGVEPAAPVITARGPHVRIAATGPSTALRDQSRLTGDYVVSARFLPTDPAGPAEYGVVIGGRAATALACLMRTDGTFALARGPVTTVPTAWMAIDAAAPPGRPRAGADQLTLRVAGSVATCAANGREIARVGVPAGGLDGAAGVYVGAGSSVELTEFTSEVFAAPPAVPAQAPGPIRDR